MPFINENDTFSYVDGDGNRATAQVVKAIASNPDGSPAGSLPQPGPAAASASLPTADAAYSSVAPYSGATTVGRAVAIICTVAGTATLTLATGSVVVPVAVGLTILPFACTNAVQTTGTMTLHKLI